MANVPALSYSQSDDGVRISYVWFPGAGDPIVYAPGLGGPPLAVRLQVQSCLNYLEALRLDQPLLTFDYRGTGFSGPLYDPISIGQLANDVGAVVRSAGQPVHLIGVFGGGTAVAAFAARSPEQVKSLSLVLPRMYGTAARPLATGMAAADWERFFYFVLRTILDFPDSDSGERLMPGYLAGLPRTTFDQWMAHLQTAELANYLPHVRCPVLLWSTLEESDEVARVAKLKQDSVVVLGTMAAFNETFGRAHREAFEEMWSLRGPAIPVVAGASGNNLSEREVAVLRCIARGMSNREIAEACFITSATVATHRPTHPRKDRHGQSRPRRLRGGSSSNRVNRFRQ